jgi:hypothetical protein
MTNINENPVNEEPEDEEPQEVECSWCCEAYPEDEMHDITYQRYGLRRHEVTINLCESCHDCMYTCNDCGTAYNGDNEGTCVDDWNGISVCGSCEDNYEHCYEHDRYHRTEDSCESCDEMGSRLINDYSFRPAPVFHFVRSGVTDLTGVSNPFKTVTGFELEMEAVDCDASDGAELANDLYGQWCYLKHDGSLSNGFEMVSHPLSHEFIAEKFPWQRLKELSHLGMRSANTRTCGLHVHINKDFFGKNPTTMYRFMSMFYRNSEQWKKIAGRSHSTYADWSEYELTRMLEYTKGLSLGSHVRNNDRYVALNLQNRNTIELRFFKGTLRPETFVARLEAAHAVAEYAYATRNSVSIKAAHDWDRFREWTIQQKTYTNFNTYADAKGV